MAYFTTEPARGSNHGSIDTEGLPCDGRMCFEVIESGRRVKKVKYWCCARHSHFDPFDKELECPRGMF